MALAASLTAEPGPDEVTFTVTVANEGTDPVGLLFPSAQTVEVEVWPTAHATAAGTGADGAADDRGEHAEPVAEPVWRYGESQLFAQVQSEVTLAPGESFGRQVAWAGPEPGEFRVRATLTASPNVRAETTLSV